MVVLVLVLEMLKVRNLSLCLALVDIVHLQNKPMCASVRIAFQHMVAMCECVYSLPKYGSFVWFSA